MVVQYLLYVYYVFMYVPETNGKTVKDSTVFFSVNYLVHADICTYACVHFACVYPCVFVCLCTRLHTHTNVSQHPCQTTRWQCFLITVVLLKL